jgi:hypothetical protein
VTDPVLTFPLSRIRQIVRDHDKVMDTQRDEMMESKAVYETRWWQNYVMQGQRTGRIAGAYQWDGAEIEVNHLHRMMRTYLSDLFPDASRAVVDSDPLDRGDPQTIQAVLNDWWKKPYGYLTVDHATMMALILPGSGFKIGYDPGTTNPIERVWMRPIPPWELILDRDAPSWEDERFRGHVYQSPIEEVLERYPQLEGKIKGAPRLDFFQQSIASNPSPQSIDGSAASFGEYVRVLEFMNLRDAYVSPGGQVYKGRMEVYVLDQGLDEPVVVAPLPDQDASGRDLPNIEPLILDHEVGYPFRPLSPAKVILPQQAELNKVRTAMARDTRRNARKYVYEEGAFDQDPLDKLNNGVDMQGVSVKPGTRPDQAVYMLPNQPISSDNIMYMRVVESDLSRVSGPSQNAQGQTTDVTKYETQVVQMFAEALLKYHAKLLYGTLARVFRLVQRAIIAAAKDSGDSEDGEEINPISDLSEAAPIDGEPGTDAPPAPAPKPKRPKVHPFVAFKIKDGPVTLDVTEDALNADCPITFVGADSTPINRATMIQFMTGPGYAAYMGLWMATQNGGPEGIISERAMQHIAEMMNLPKDMHPAAMKSALKENEPKAAVKAPKGVMAGPPPPPAAAPPSPQAAISNAINNALMAMRRAAQENPDVAGALGPAAQSLAAAVAAAEAGDMATVAESVSAALEALPEGVVPNVEEILRAIVGEMPAGEAAAPEMEPEVGDATV